MDIDAPTNHQEFVDLAREVTAARNRFSHRSGFSPVQRVFGISPRMPGSTLADDSIDPVLVSANPSTEFQRAQDLRRLANRVVVEDDTAEALDKAVKAKHRIEKHYVEGEIVFVWRKNPLSAGWWQGPGLVVLAQGNNVWISIKGGLCKCGRTQLRPATSEEQMGCELINKHLPSLYRALKSNGQKRFVDITNEEDAPVDPRVVGPPAEPEAAEPAAPVEPTEPVVPATPSTAAPAASPMEIESALATPGTVSRDLPDASTPAERPLRQQDIPSMSVAGIPVIPEESLEPELHKLCGG